MDDKHIIDDLDTKDKEQLRLAMHIGIPLGLGVLSDELLDKLLFYLEIEARARDEERS